MGVTRLLTQLYVYISPRTLHTQNMHYWADFEVMYQLTF
jgi:hypothetical protein